MISSAELVQLTSAIEAAEPVDAAATFRQAMDRLAEAADPNETDPHAVQALLEAALLACPSAVTAADADLALALDAGGSAAADERAARAWRLTHALSESRDALGGDERLAAAGRAAQVHEDLASTAPSRRTARTHRLYVLSERASRGYEVSEEDVVRLVGGLFERAGEEEALETARITDRLAELAGWTSDATWEALLDLVTSDVASSAEEASAIATSLDGRAGSARTDDDKGEDGETDTGNRLDRLRFAFWARAAAASDDPHAHEWAGYLITELVKDGGRWALDAEALDDAVRYLSRSLEAVQTSGTRTARLRDRAKANEALAGLEGRTDEERLQHLERALGDAIEVLDVSSSGPTDDDIDRCRRLTEAVRLRATTGFSAISTAVRSAAEVRTERVVLSGVVADVVEVGREFHAAVWIPADAPWPEVDGHYTLVISSYGGTVERRDRSTLEACPADALAVAFRATSAGRAEIRIECFSGPSLLATLEFVIEVIGPTPSFGVATTAGPVGATEPDLTLIVHHESGSLTFTALSRALGLAGQTWDPVRLEGDHLARLQAVLAPVVDGLERWVEAPSSATAAAVRHEITSAGSELGEHLLPRDLRHRLRDAVGTISDVLILSDETWIPWELIVVGHTPDDATGLADAFTLTRWVRGTDPSRRPHGRTLVRAFLPELADDVSPQLGAASAAVARIGWDATDARMSRIGILDDLNLLEAGAWHIVTHGVAPTADRRSDDVVLDLDDGARLELRDLTEERCHQIARLHPLIFLNACTTAGTRRTFAGLEGWAAKLIRYGASAVVATHWPVTVDAANVFAADAYGRLADGATLPEAVRAARSQVREQLPDDPSWAAFAVFADPGVGLIPAAPSP